MSKRNSKVVRLRCDVLEQAVDAAKHLTGKQLTETDAISVCVHGSTPEAHKRVLDLLQAKTIASTIANTAAAVEHFTGRKIEVHVKGDRWWLSGEGEEAPYPLGRADPSLVATEMAKLGRGLDLQATIQ